MHKIAVAIFTLLISATSALAITTEYAIRKNDKVVILSGTLAETDNSQNWSTFRTINDIASGTAQNGWRMISLSEAKSATGIISIDQINGIAVIMNFTGKPKKVIGLDKIPKVVEQIDQL